MDGMCICRYGGMGLVEGRDWWLAEGWDGGWMSS